MSNLSEICLEILGELKRVQYVLMNKDKYIVRFIVEVDTATGDSLVIESEESLPDSVMFNHGIESWLLRRKAPVNRAYVSKILGLSACNTMEGYFNVTNALSLNDTYWVKPDSSNSKWKDISLYRNTFSSVIAKTAFTGVDSKFDLRYSPEFTTDGTFPKCWVREGSNIYLYKAAALTRESKGIEPYCEYYASQVAREICNNSIEYDLSKLHGQVASKCKLFTSEGQGFRQWGNITYTRKLRDILNATDAMDIGDDIRRMIVFDALVANTDRHLGNFGVIVDNDSENILQFAPIFDFNQALFPNTTEEDYGDLRRYYNMYSIPRLGTDFIGAAKFVMTDSIRKDLKRLESFEFSKHLAFNLDDNRLHALGDFVRKQARLILE